MDTFPITGTQKRKYSNLSKAEADKKRQCVNKQERARQHTISDTFKELAELLPKSIGTDRKAKTKIAIIKEAIDTIDYLENLCNKQRNLEKPGGATAFQHGKENDVPTGTYSGYQPQEPGVQSEGISLGEASKSLPLHNFTAAMTGSSAVVSQPFRQPYYPKPLTSITSPHCQKQANTNIAVSNSQKVASNTLDGYLPSDTNENLRDSEKNRLCVELAGSSERSLLKESMTAKAEPSSNVSTQELSDLSNKISPGDTKSKVESHLEPVVSGNQQLQQPVTKAITTTEDEYSNIVDFGMLLDLERCSSNFLKYSSQGY